MKEKRIPLRQCMGCRAHKPKAELLRVVRSPEGLVAIDDRGRAQGRGVYLCRDPGCLRKVRKNRGLERSLKSAMPPEVILYLESQTGAPLP